jgi:hypothetical protein
VGGSAAAAGTRGLTVPGSPDPAVAARARWRAAEDRLYPTLLTDPHAYQRGLSAVHAVLDELRRRDADLAGLLAADAAPDELVAAACPQGSTLPAELLTGVACGLRDRELQARDDARRREEKVRAARADGAAWAVLAGPADPAELCEPLGGRRTALHLASGTVLEAVLDPWDRDAPFSVTRYPGEARTFRDRDAWLAAIATLEADVEAGPPPV